MATLFGYISLSFRCVVESYFRNTSRSLLDGACLVKTLGIETVRGNYAKKVTSF